MGRKAKLGQKNGYWYSEAGGVARYFGKVSETDLAIATKRFHEALAKPKTDREEIPKATVNELVKSFLAWLERHRSDRTHTERGRHLKRFVASYGSIRANAITSSHLERFLDGLSKRHATDYVAKHATSIKAMCNWGIRFGYLPSDFRPFATIEPIRPTPKALLESDLPTREEYEALLRHAKRFRGLGDLLQVYYATGARTHELTNAKVGDYQKSTTQLVLRSHKRSKTMKDPVPRRISLNETAKTIVERLCQGRLPDEPLFARPSGKPWTSIFVANRFQIIRKRSKVRDSISVYSFRHLWISEALMAGIDAMLIAKMAGTSVRMIETVYGHWRTQSFTDAMATLDRSRSRL